MTESQVLQGESYAMQLELLNAINRAQSTFIAHANDNAAFDQLLSDLLALTDSEYGFIGEVLRTPAGDPYLKTQAITNVAWNDATRAFYTENAPTGMAFYNLKSLFGAVLTSAKPVIANDPNNDPRRGGLPAGHPPLNAFLGIPILVGDRLVAMAGMSNRPGGYNQAVLDFLQPLLVTIGQLVEARNNQLARRHSETAFAQTSSLLASVLDAASEVSIIATDPEGLITVFNRGAENLLGYTADEVVGKLSPAPFHLPAEVAVRGEELSKDLGYPVTGFRVFIEIPEQQGAEQREWTYVRKSGEYVPVSLVVTAMRSPAGKITGYLGIAQNITKRKQAEHELSQFKSTLDRTLDCVFMFDATSLRFFYANQGALKQVGYELDELLAMHPYDIKPDVTEAQFHELIAPLLAGDQASITFETVHQHKNGQRLPVEIFLQYIAPVGEAPRFVAMVRDISERKRDQIVLQEQAQHTQAILNNMVDGLITIDQAGIIASFNLAAERIFGYMAEEVLGQNVKILMPNPHRDAHDSYLRNYQTTGVARIIGIGREVEGQRKDGSLFPMELAVSEVTRQGAPLYVGMVRDITERKRMDRMKSEFVSTVSHELRTPLTSISGALGLLAGGAMGSLPEQARTLIDIAHKNSQRLTHLINDLLDMEKIAAGKMHFDLQPHALIPVIEQALEANRAYGAERRVGFVLNHQASGIEVRVDSQRLMQVLSNLLSNAVKYSPEDGTVEIAVRQLDGRVRVEVSDHGPGIPAAFHSRIFQKFSQADSSDTRQKGGTGLGLAITRELVERMDGRIGFESVEGQGASFFFELPLWNTSGPNSASVSLSSLAMADTPRILVVEDEPDIAQLLNLMLTRAGYAVDTAANGAQALQALRQSRYAALSLDLMLPDISGLEIIRQVRQQPETANLPIIVVSAKMEEGRLAINGDFSGIDWLAKPINEGRLLSAVEKNLPVEMVLRPRVLHVEDDADLHKVIRAMVGGRYEFELATSLADARAHVAQERFDVVILDLSLPDGSGWDLLPTLQALQPAPRVIILSGTDITPDEVGKVEAALLKSQVSPRDLLDAIHTSIQQSNSSGSAS